MVINGVNKNLFRYAEDKLYLSLKRKAHRSRVHSLYGSSSPNEGEIVWVDPKEIAGHMYPRAWRALRVKTGFDGGAVLGGTWDIDSVDYIDFTNVDPYTSCYEHWIEGKDWSQTSLYRYYVDKVSRGQSSRFPSVKVLKERYDNLDVIFSDVMRRKEMSLDREDLVRVSIARDGRLIWGPDGRHRICVAMCAGIERMPARLGFVHSDAIEHLQQLRGLAEAN